MDNFINWNNQNSRIVRNRSERQTSNTRYNGAEGETETHVGGKGRRNSSLLSLKSPPYQNFDTTVVVRRDVTDQTRNSGRPLPRLPSIPNASRHSLS